MTIRNFLAQYVNNEGEVVIVVPVACLSDRNVECLSFERLCKLFGYALASQWRMLAVTQW